MKNFLLAIIAFCLLLIIGKIYVPVAQAQYTDKESVLLLVRATCYSGSSIFARNTSIPPKADKCVEYAYLNNASLIKNNFN
tara:strand:- start:193 stop:435 length:243 start_codon:yes stop_codon:yes gene_type:complete